MANEERPLLPGIIPIMQYQFQISRALFTEAYIKKAAKQYHSSYARQNAQALVRSPYYGIAKYTAIDGSTRVVDGGFMMQRIYDFCGGLLVSSAWTATHATVAQANEWAPHPTWKSAFYGAMETDGPRCKELMGEYAVNSWPKYADVIPDLHVYCGPDPLLVEQARDIMRRSLGAAMVTMAKNNARRAVFVADRVSLRPLTRDTLRAAAAHGIVYDRLPGVMSWPDEQVTGEYGKEATLMPFTTMLHAYHNTSTFSGGEPYINPNTHHEVAVCKLLSGENTKRLEFVLPTAESEKFKNPLLLNLLPQSAFHNG